MKRFGLGDILLLLVNGGAVAYSAARSWHVISNSLPPEMMIFGVVALAVTEVALVGWEVYYLQSAKCPAQKGIALLMFLAQLAVTGALVAGDTWMVVQPDAAPEFIKLAVLWSVPAILVSNIAALFGVHAADPDAQLAQAKLDVRQAIHAQTVAQLREGAAQIASEVSGTGAKHYADETRAEFLRSFSGNGHGKQTEMEAEGVSVQKSSKRKR
jgi:hypothetical protein